MYLCSLVRSRVLVTVLAIAVYSIIVIKTATTLISKSTGNQRAQLLTRPHSQLKDI